MAPTENETNSTKLLRAFTPVRVFLRLTGQLPFIIYKRADGTREFQFHFWNLNTLVFGLLCIVNSVVYLMVTVGFVTAVIGFHIYGEGKAFKINATTALSSAVQKPWEEVMLANHFALVIVVYSYLTLTFVSSMYILFNGKYYVHYWNYWSRAVQITDIDPTKGVRSYLMVEIILYLIVIAIECSLFLQLHGMRAVAGVYATMILRFIKPGIPGDAHFPIAQICGYALIIYGHVGSRAIIIQFVFFSKLLANTSSVYNGRLLNAEEFYLNREPEEAKAKRESFRLLLKDQLTIGQLFRMTSSVFGPVLKAYYLTELVGLLFEVVYMWKLLGPDSVQAEALVNSSVIFPQILPRLHPPSKSERFQSELLTSETFLTTMLLLQTLISCYLTTSSANDAHNMAMSGYKIIRRRTYFTCRTKTERNFIHNMITSYARSNPPVISGGGYFHLTKAVFAGMILSACGFYVILIQFEYPRYTVTEDAYLRNWKKT